MENISVMADEILYRIRMALNIKLNIEIESVMIYISYLCSSANVELAAQLGVLLEPHEIHDDGVDGGYEEGDVDAIVLRPVDPGDLIAAHVSRRLAVAG